MNKLLLGAAAAALAASVAHSAFAVPLPNYDAALAAPASTLSLSKGADHKSANAKLRLAASQRGAHITNKVRGQQDLVDAKLGVSTFVWSKQREASAPLFLKADKLAESSARSFLAKNSSKLGLSKAALENAQLISRHDIGRGPIISKFQQTHRGVEVFGRQLNVVMDREMRPVASSGYFAPDPGVASSAKGGLVSSAAAERFKLGAEKAIGIAFNDASGSRIAESALSSAGKSGNYTRYSVNAATVGEYRLASSRAKKVYFPIDNALVPAWQIDVFAVAKDNGDRRAYTYAVSAADGKVLFRKNQTEQEAFAYRAFADATGLNQPFDGPIGNEVVPLAVLDPEAIVPRIPASTNLVTLEHGPISTGDPWLPADATETLGNNVDAYLDLFAREDEDLDFAITGGYDPELGDYRAAVNGTRMFDYDYTADSDPLTETQRSAAIVNLFYMNNWLHDFWYDNGFDEVSGNAQASNFGRGGIEGDRLRAEGQDFGGRNNANMTTYPDGEPAIMQMYVFDGPAPSRVTITSPALGTLPNGTAAFGADSFDLTAEVVAYEPALACTAATNAAALAGKIALISRGTCGFSAKAFNAQTAGAAGVIIANNVEEIINMSTGGEPVTIPVLSVTLSGGAAIFDALADGPVTARLFRAEPAGDRDGTMDNGIIAHEWFHYTSNRLVVDATGLVNQQGRGMGEGWADFSALVLSVRADDLAVSTNAAFGGAYSTGSYVDESAYFGIRRAPYSVNPGIFPMTFKHIEDGVPLPDTAPLAFGQSGVDNAEVHNVGEIWANSLWTFYVALLNKHSFSEAQNRIKDYVIAGLKLTPYAPTLLEARDGVLAAAKATDQGDYELAAEAFAKMGMGVGAVAPDRFDETNSGVVESFVGLAGAFEVTDVSFDFGFEDGTQGYKDLDGVLDAGETALLSVTIRSNGTLDLDHDVTANISSDGDVSFGNGGTLVFDTGIASAARAAVVGKALAIGDTLTASIPVTLNAAGIADFLGLTIEFPDTGDTADAVIEPAPETPALYVNYDIQGGVSASDDVEQFLASQVDWTPTLISGSADNWTTTADFDGFFDSGTGWYIPDNGAPSDYALESPEIEVGDADFSFSFEHYFQFENAGYLGDGTPVSYDGGVLEVSIDGGEWLDVLDAGGTFTQGGYNGWVIVFDEENWRIGFADSNEDFFAPVTVDFGTALAGSSVRFRFRAASDINTGEFGWFVDNISVSGADNLPFSAVVADGAANDVNRPPHVIVPAAFSTPERAAGSTTQATVALSGGANDLDGPEGLSYVWTQTGGPAVTLAGATTANASFTAPRISVDTVLTFSLTVTDTGGISDTKSVTVTITNVNSAPVVNAGAAQTVSNGSAVTLAGTATDADGETLTLLWTQTAGEPVTLSGADTLTPMFTTDVAGTRTFRLAATDPDGATSTATTTVSVQQPINGGGSFGWLMILAGLLGFAGRRIRRC